MSKGSASTITDEVDQTTLEDETIATAQEAIPVPLFWGTVCIAPRYITPIYGQRTQQAQTDRPSGKK